MTEYRITIVAEGQDRASGPLGNVNSVLSRMGEIAGGVLLAGALSNIAEGLGGIVASAWDAAASFQVLQIQLEGLLAVQMAAEFDKAHMREVSSQVIIGLNEKEQESLIKLQDQYDDAGFKIATMQERLAKMGAKGQEGSAAYNELSHNIAELQDQMSGWSSEIDVLTAKQSELSTVTKMVAGETATASQFTEQAREAALKFTDWIADFAVKTQYTVQSLSQISNGFLAIGYSVGDTQTVVDTLAKLGSGLGISEAKMENVVYALQSMTREGKVSEVRLRQLATAGIPFSQVLDLMAAKAGKTREEMLKFLKSSEDGPRLISEGLTEFANKNFPDALEKMSSTWAVAASNVRDAIESIGGKEVLGPVMNQLSAGVAGMITILLSHRGEFRQIGVIISETFDRMMVAGGSLMTALQNLGSVILKTLGIELPSFDLVQTIQGAADGLVNFTARATTFVDWLTVALQPALMWMRDHWVEIQGAIAGVSAVLGGSVIVGVLAAIGAAIAALATPMTLLIVGAGLLGAAWNGNWYGIRDTLTSFWVGTAQPILSQLWTWLQTNVPAAIQTLSNYWSTVLWPAMQSLWSWVTTTLIPGISTFISVTLTSFQTGLQVLTNVWTGVLLPGLKQVHVWLSTLLFPLIQSISQFISAIFSKAIEGLAALWLNILWPALKKVGSYLAETIKPVWEQFQTFLDGPGTSSVKSIHTVLVDLARLALGALDVALHGIAKAIREVTDWFDTMAEKIKNLKLPSWLTPGSPTPLETGLLGIASAMDQLSRSSLPDFSSGLNNLSGPRYDQRQYSYGGDSFSVQIADQSSGADFLRYIEQQRQARLSKSMGG